MSMIETPLTSEEMLDVLRTIRSRIPGYTILTQAEMNRLYRAAYVHPNFVGNILDLIDGSMSLARALDRTTGDVREEEAEVEGWDAVATELLALYEGVLGANLVRRHRIGLFTLQAYNIARQLARRSSDVTPEHILELKKLQKWLKVREGRRRRRAEEPQTPAE